METVTERPQSPIRLELNRYQVLHIASLVASALSARTELPDMLRMELECLYDIFMEPLPSEDQVRVEKVINMDVEEMP